MFFIGNLKNQHVNDPKMSGYKAFVHSVCFIRQVIVLRIILKFDRIILSLYE